ncbi:hypothetical protein AAFF_G00271370 [Aldrovandia affinis]|uniref:C3H1-type domain-containing protein n=1 Tax=Aldrovandia affinis TaxID=143900 RepID=A0AAD7W239_9TELE|nr:hypothetical protein AAFF_G00271370 [Aldrovandia affinis]
MAFTSLFSSFPGEGLHVVDCALDERGNAGAIKVEIEYEGFGVAKVKKEKQCRTEKIDASSRNGQQEEPEKRCRQRPIPAPYLCWGGSVQELKPRKFDGQFPQDEHSRLVNSKKHSIDFACELDQYRQAKKAPPPPPPPNPFPPQQTGGSSQKKKKKKNKRAQVKPGNTSFHKGTPKKPGPSQKGRAQQGKNWGQGRGPNKDKARAGPKQERKKVFTEEYLRKNTLDVQGRHICKYFLRGTCTMGDRCNFDHDLNVQKLELYITRELLRKALDYTPVSTEPLNQTEQELTVQDCAPLPPEGQLTVDMSENIVTVRSSFYNRPSATESQSEGSPILPQSGGGLNERRALPGVSPGLQRGPHVHTDLPADLALEMGPLRPPVEVHDELMSSAVQRRQGGPKPVTSILKTLFLDLGPAHEEGPQSSSPETGVSASQPGSSEAVNGWPAALVAEKRLARGVVPGGQGAKMCDRLESAPSCSMLSAWDGDGEGEGNLREEPVLVPLEAVPGLAGRDPRTPRRMTTIVLPLPPFAQMLKWSIEHLIPPPPQPPPHPNPNPNQISPPTALASPLTLSTLRWAPPNSPSAARLSLGLHPKHHPLLCTACQCRHWLGLSGPLTPTAKEPNQGGGALQQCGAQVDK